MAENHCGEGQRFDVPAHEGCPVRVIKWGKDGVVTLKFNPGVLLTGVEGSEEPDTVRVVLGISRHRDVFVQVPVSEVAGGSLPVEELRSIAKDLEKPSGMPRKRIAERIKALVG